MDLNLTYKANFVPMLSRREIEKIAQSVLSEIQPECLKEPQSTDLDFLIRGFLKMNYEEQYLSNNALFLGLTVFKADKVIIFNPEIRRAEYFPAKDNTIFIEKSLCGDEESLGRKRFTQAHEAGHALFHRRYYEGKGRGDYQTGSEEENSSYESTRNFSDTDWLEWQANAFASAVLMPLTAMKILQSRYQGLEEEAAKDLMIVGASTLFEVSETAALLRLKSLGMVERTYRPERNNLSYLRQFRSGLRKRNGGT